MNASHLPMPTSNADSADYWRFAADGVLALQTCRSCGTRRFPPRHLCPTCWSDQSEWSPASGRGTVYAATVVRRAPSPEYKDLVPYTLALVELEEGPRIISNIIGSNALNAKIGDRVEVTFERREGGSVPQFELVKGS